MANNQPKALLSVSDKTGIDRLAQFLVAQGIEVLSTGGTAKFLDEQGVAYRQVSDYTGFPEMLDGRLKTLQPKIHGGILARREVPEHMAACREHGIAAIDWVVVNLYPFAETIRKPGCTLEDAIEHIDIGGPSLLRAAAKNHGDVVVCADPADYDRLIAEYQTSGAIGQETRFELATKVFAHTALYDARIADYLAGMSARAAPLSSVLTDVETLRLSKIQSLRYGENPHQSAALYVADGSSLPWRQLQGKELSYNNLIDMTAAWELAAEFSGQYAAVIVKHTNPCGVGISAHGLAAAFERAKAGDPVSAFGGIVALSHPVDEATASAVSDLFIELIIAPAFDALALARLSSKKNLRLITLDRAASHRSFQEYRRVLGGILSQEGDIALKPADLWQWVTTRTATEAERHALEVAWKAVKHVKSNAIVIATSEQVIGVGAGQMSRIDSVRIAGEKAQFFGHSLAGAALASDAFFPFRDNIDAAARLGIKAIVQPGGSVRDDEVIAGRRLA